MCEIAIYPGNPGYNTFRTAAMNQKYYRYVIERTQKTNLGLEIIIALGATVTGVSGWALWETDAGLILWPIIASVSALIAVIKPMLNFSKKIEKYSKMYAGYADIYYKIRTLKEFIESRQAITEEDYNTYNEIPNLFKELAILEEELLNIKLLTKCQEKVNRENPPDSFWMPKTRLSEAL